MPALPLRGSLWVLILYDVAEEIRLDQLRNILGSGEPLQREPSFRHPAPDYVRFERPPVVQTVDASSLGSGAPVNGQLKYFDYGVVSLEVELPFETNWEGLVQIASRWIGAPEIEQRAEDLVKGSVERARPAFDQPYESWLNEDYYIVHLCDALDESGNRLETAALLNQHGGEVAQIVRGESLPLSNGERSEVLRSSMSYYPSDLIVAGWVGALIYDTPEGAAPARQLLEYANTQLLEFRHYDERLTSVLSDVYKSLERRGGVFRRWRLAAEAERLNRLRLDITELAERTDNAIKFLSDMFYARAYRMASDRVGVTDYRKLVDEKLRTAGELYEFMVNEFHQARAFVLEFMVVAILIIELANLFFGRRP
jgi:hypothetical protein